MSGKSQKSLREVKKKILTDTPHPKKKTEINLNSKLCSRRSDGLHFLEEGHSILLETFI